MANLIEDRTTPEVSGDVMYGNAAAGVTVYAGAMVGRNLAGEITPLIGAAGLVGVGVADRRVDNSSGIAGAEIVEYRPGIRRFANSAGADEITAADIGALIYAADDQTVAKTDGTATRSPAGHVHQVDALGVWVRFDEALTRISAA